MKQRIKNFLFKKRVKILRNNKGLSLIEIMVALGLIGLLTALAVPQYRSYQRDIRYGVLKSMVRIPYKTIEIEESVGNPLSSITGGFLWNRVKSKDKGEFDHTFNASGNAWCFILEGKATSTTYKDYEGCIDQSGGIQIGGKNVPCSQAQAKTVDGDSGGGTNCVYHATTNPNGKTTQCPQNCTTDW